MKPQHLLIVLAAIVIILLLSRKPIKQAISRGYRNNNPGNIVKTYDREGNQTFWNGEVKGDDKRFKKFKSMDWGYRAIFITLRSYINKGVNTIEKIIFRYAPPSENQSMSYAKHVSERSGIPIDKVISFSNIDDIKAIIKEISFIENGIKPDLNQIEAGYKLFLS